MSLLTKALDLLRLASNNGLDVSSTVRTLDLMKLIKSSADCDPEVINEILKAVTSARTKKEKELKKKKERKEKEKEKEREEKLKEREEKEKEREEKEKERELVEKPAPVNRLINEQDHDGLLPYTFMGEVNGFKMPIIRDMRSTIDVVWKNRIRPEMLAGEHLWIQLPFDKAPLCWPLAEAELKGEFGQILTKAAVVWDQEEKERYLLGNGTAALLEKAKEGLILHQVNAIQTRAEKRIAEQEQTSVDMEDSRPDDEEEVEIIPDDDTEKERENFSFPRIENNHEKLSLLNVDTGTLVVKQKECQTLKDLVEKVARKDPSEISKGYEILPSGRGKKKI